MPKPVDSRMLFKSLVKTSLGKTAIACAALVAALTMSSTPALASNQNGTITKMAFTNGRVLFWMSGSKTGTVPSCDCCARWEINTNTAWGQALMSLVMTAYAQGKQVWMTGSGQCVQGSGDTEGVHYIETI